MTLTRPRVATLRRIDADTLARLAFGVVCVAVMVGFFVFPTYPNYDSYYSLLWAREVLHGQLPVFQGFRVPTEHPLAILAGIALVPFGDSGDRIWVLLTLVAFLGLVAGVYRMGRVAATPLVGGVAAALLLTRFDYPFLAARGYVDIPYMALVVWAAVLEAARPRRGVPVFVLLAAAGLLRPEAWLLAAAYWVWMAWRATWRERLLYAALAAIAPVLWAGVDWAVTGDPLFSLHYTSSSAEDLGRQKSLSELPAAVPSFFASLVKLPVLAASAVGLVLGVLMSPKRMVMPLLLVGAGLGTFVLIGLAGASVIERYLAVAALALMVFAAVALAGWTMLVPGFVRTAWMLASVLVVIMGAGWTALHLNLSRFQSELVFRGEAHESLERVLSEPRVRAGLRCGPLTTPNHKLVPDSRWIARLGPRKVLARASRAGARARRGVALVVTSRFALFKHAFTDPTDSALIEVPPAGMRRVATSRFYAAYVGC